jgi:hypothetical protein
MRVKLLKFIEMVSLHPGFQAQQAPTTLQSTKVININVRHQEFPHDEMIHDPESKTAI